MLDEEQIKEDRRKQRQLFYAGKRWIECRDYMRQKFPLCQDCLKEGKIVAMGEVHHIKSPFARNISPEEKERRAYSEDNLVCLCKDCHIKRHLGDKLSMKEKMNKYQ